MKSYPLLSFLMRLAGIGPQPYSRVPRLALAWHRKPPTNGKRECARRQRQANDRLYRKAAREMFSRALTWDTKKRIHGLMYGMGAEGFRKAYSK